MSRVHLVKLCVGAETVQDLKDWQATKRAQTADGLPRHITRMWPKREGELVAGGSLYWVIKGLIQARQVIERLDPYDSPDGIKRCAIVLNPTIVATQAAPKRPFQGWRYLKMEEAPNDLTAAQCSETPLPPSLAAALAEIGVR